MKLTITTHSQFDEEQADYHQHWLDKEFRQCAETMVQAYRRYLGAHPDGPLLSEAEEIEFEAGVWDLLTDAADKYITRSCRWLEENGFDAPAPRSRWQILRARMAAKERIITNPATYAAKGEDL